MKIQSGFNKNPDEESTLTFTLHGDKTKSKLQKIRNYQKVKLLKITNKKQTHNTPSEVDL